MNETQTADEKPVEVKEEVKPPQSENAICPYCRADPTMVLMRTMQMGPVTTAIIYCGNKECRSIFSVTPIGAAQPQQQIQIPDGRMTMHLPGRPR